MREPMQPSVLLAIPAYNCEKQIPRVLDGIDEELASRLRRIIVIDNRSTDGTAEAAALAGRRFGERFAVWRNTENYGLGGTHKVAFDHAVDGAYEYVAILHGDDQATPGELERLLERAQEDPGAAAVLGSRFSRGSRRIGYSRTRVAGNLAFNVLFTVVSLRRTVDLGSGLNLFATAELADRFYRALDDRITFNLDLLLAFYSRGCRLAYEPITWSESDQVSNARNVSVGLTALRRLFAWRFRRRASRVTRVAYTSEAIA